MFQSKKKSILIIAICAFIVIISLIVGIAIYNNAQKKTDVDYISIKSLPEKIEYYQDEIFSTLGLEIEATLKNGKTLLIATEKCSFSGFDSSVPTDTQIITVTYQGANTSFQIKIKPLGSADGINGSFNGLSFKTLPKTEYKVGEWLDIDGGILILHYDDGSTKEVPLELSDVYGFTSMQAGTYELTVRHIEDGFLATCTYTITVTE